MTRQSRRWGSAGGPWDGNCTVGADGWPNQSDFGNVFVTLATGADTVGPSVAGNWSVFFEGNATIVPFQGNFAVAGQAYDAASDTTALTLVAPASAKTTTCNCIMFSFAGASTRAGGPGLKNIRVLQPGYGLAQADDFSAPLMALLAGFDVLRFMDWAATNGNTHVEWTDRTLPTHYTYASGGVPWETIIALANAAGKDPWINVPALASDDYVLQLATLVKALLAPDRSVFVEYSNEVCVAGSARARRPRAGVT